VTSKTVSATGGYAASDVYLVAEAPDDGDELVDTSGTPSTIVSPGTMFIEETIAITAPSGTTGEGTYSIVYDSCQDGIYQPTQDSLFPDVVTVEMPAELPPVDAAIAALKTDAQTEWGRWQLIGKLFDSLINVDKYAGCAELDAGDCLDLIKMVLHNAAGFSGFLGGGVPSRSQLQPPTASRIRVR